MHPRANDSFGAAPLPLGTRLLGRYRLESTLGAGGMAQVYAAVDEQEQKRVAVKVLRSVHAENAEAIARLKREGNVLRSLAHPAIVGLDALHETGGFVFLVMELLEGETLAVCMRRGPLSPLELAPIVTGIAVALSAAHQAGVVHRDLKPENVFLVPDGHGGRRVKLLDFGISKTFGGDKLTQTGEVLGTPRYMSPEQLGSEADIDHRADLYSLGVVMYEALTGSSPFAVVTPTELIVAIVNGKAVPLRAVRPDLRGQVETVVMRAISKDRRARFQSAIELADAYVEASGFARERAAERLPSPASARTAVLGSRTPGELATATFDTVVEAHAPPAPDLVPGTLSFDESSKRRVAFPATSMSPIDASTLPPVGVDAAPVVARTVSMDRSALPSLEPTPVAGSERAGQMGSRTLSHGSVAPEVPPTLPMRRLPTWAILVLAVFLAGASALAVAAVLPRLFAPASTTDTSVDAGVAPAPSPAETPATTLPPGVAPPPGVEVPAPPASAEEHRPSTETHEHRPTSEHPRRPTSETTPETTPEPTPRNDPSNERPPDPPVLDPVELARRALEGGDVQRCVDVLSEAISHGASPLALRRRADCLLRLGFVDRALGDYCRFTMISPDHPSIPEIRRILADRGLTCP